MSKVAFKVDNGIEPSKTQVGDIGTTDLEFKDLYIARDAFIDRNLVVQNLTVNGSSNVGGGTGGGGADEATIIAYATALAY
jgi:hypothetical protein